MPTASAWTSASQQANECAGCSAQLHDGTVQQRADSAPRRGIPEADETASAGHREAASVGRVLDRERGSRVGFAALKWWKGLEATPPAQGLGVDKVDPAVLAFRRRPSARPG